MTPTEAVALAGYMRAHFPSQPIDDYTADALGELLEPYDLAACRAAVLRIAKRNHEGDSGKSKWCSPTDVYAEVRRDRAKRISQAEPIDLGDLDPDDTGAFIDRLVDRRLRLAAGEEVTEPVAIDGPRRDVLRELGMAGKSVNEELADKAERVKAAHREARFILQAEPEPPPAPVYACEAATTTDDGIVICAAPATTHATDPDTGRPYPACGAHGAVA